MQVTSYADKTNTEQVSALVRVLQGTQYQHRNNVITVYPCVRINLTPLTANSRQCKEMWNVDQHGSALFIHNTMDGLTLNVTRPNTLAIVIVRFQLQVFVGLQ